MCPRMFASFLGPLFIFCISRSLRGQVLYFLFSRQIICFSALEGYFFYRALVTVFDTNRLSTIIHYAIGYGLPVCIVLLTVSISEAGSGDLYLRKNNEDLLVACWLSTQAMPAIVVPAGECEVFLNLLQ